MNILNNRSSIYSPGWLQLVFHGNNTKYGAYIIRMMHRHYLGTAILWSIAAAALISLTLVVPHWIAERHRDLPDENKGVIDLTPPPFVPRFPEPEAAPVQSVTKPQPKPGGAPKVVRSLPPVIRTEPDPDPSFTDPSVNPGSTPASGTSEPGNAAIGSDLDPPASTGVFRVVEVNPHFKGGDTELIRYLRKNIRYPDEAKRKGIAGVVNIEFTIAEDGTVTDLYINSGIGGGCDEEAIRVVKNMPRWTPGRQAGMAVPVRLNLPIRFSLK